MLTLRPVLLTLTCLALTACGGSGSAEDDPGTTSQATDPRAGYFHETESMNLNPPLKQYDTAQKKHSQGNDACNKEASRLYAAGATPRKSVQCHFRRNKALIDANAKLRAAVSQLDGDYRAVCDTQIKRLSAALGKVNAALLQVRKDWNVYSNSGSAPSKLTRDNRAADIAFQQILDQDVSKLSTACYTAADRAEAEASANDKS